MTALHEQVVWSQGGYPIGHSEPDRAYWAIKLNDGRWLCELDQVDARIDKIVTQDNPFTGLRDGIGMTMEKRNLDWTLDICSTGDWAYITELWMICPPTHVSPAGNTARLPISPAGTAFQFKVGVLDSNFGESLRRPLAQIIGRVTNQETGDCECHVFDYGAGALIVHENGKDNEGHPIYGPWKTNVYNMSSWRPQIPGQPSVAPIGRLSFDVLGLHFGNRLKYEDDCGCSDTGKEE